MLLVMEKLEHGSLEPTIGRSIVAFGAAENCALESRAAIAAAGEILTDFIRQDLTDLASRREAINANAYLPACLADWARRNLPCRHGECGDIRDDRLNRR